LSLGPRRCRQALRLRRTAARPWGLTAQRGQNKEAFVPLLGICAECKAGR